MSNIKAFIMKPKDNVATVLDRVEMGNEVQLAISNEQIAFIVKGIIPAGHKFAIKDIAFGQPVVKYGETIGVATQSIMVGEHVHVHNVESCRGRGDK